MNRTILLFALTVAFFSMVNAQDTIPDFDTEFELEEYTVKSEGTKKLKFNVGNSELITSAELTRAACCNLGESFTTNPSVDVDYTDAATGARQIKLLGLSGTYVQMLTENVPNLRGIASPYGLSYIPGPWLQSIQVSKGASSVKNGFESITGQINVELRKPQTARQLNINAYGDSEGKVELNASGNLHFGDKWSGGFLLHGENSFRAHDSNDDGFVDMPKIKQVSLMNRWAYLGSSYVFQVSAKGMLEKRESGQIGHHSAHIANPYITDIDSRRIELFTKNAFIFDKDNDGNIALIASGSLQDLNSSYGYKLYDAFQKEAYLSLMYERKWNTVHSFSAGLSFQYDNYHQHYRLTQNPQGNSTRWYTHEGVAGAYAQYTLNLSDKFIGMAGLRYDYSSLYGSFVTPRMHLRFNPNDDWSLHASVGTGRKSPHPLAEFSYVFASSREVILPASLRMESGVNTGFGATWSRYLGDRKLSVSAEYYYTHFAHQMAMDLNTNPHYAIITCDSRSKSNAFQLEVTGDIIEDFTITAAYRHTDVKLDYGNGYIQKPLTSKHKGLLTMSYAPWMGKWQFDATLLINGGGDMPTPYLKPDKAWSWADKYPTFCQLNLQVTKNFRKWSIYIGGENLTNYRQKNPIIDAANPWGKDFDATMVWGPLHGAMVYVGFRYNLTKY